MVSEKELNKMFQDVINKYSVRALGNIDITNLNVTSRARVIGQALREKGGLSGFKLGRRLIAFANTIDITKS